MNNLGGTRETYSRMDGVHEEPTGPRNDGDARLNRQRWITVALIGLVPLAALLIYHAVRFNGLANADALDFAQAARNLASGRGFSTYILRPLALSHGDDATRQPDLVHGPLYSFVLALAFGLAGARDTVVSTISGLCYLLTMPILYMLGLKLFRPAIARVATLVFALNPLVLDYASSGTHIPLATLLATSLFLVMIRLMRNSESPTPDASPNRDLAWAGILTALVYLTDPIFFWIVPAVSAAIIWSRPAKGKASLVFGLSLAVVALPWMIRNGVLTGNPIFGLRGAEVWMGTGVYPGNIGYRMLPGSFAPTTELFESIVQKLLIGLNQIVQGLPRLSSTLILAFFVPSLLFRLKDESADSLRRTSLLCFASLCLGMLLFGVEISLLLCLLPILLLFSVAYIGHMFQQARIVGLGLTAAYTLMGAVTLYPLFNDVALVNKAHLPPLAASARILGKQSQPGDVCVTDQPFSVAWYADRPALWAPVRDAQMREAAIRIKGLRWLLITEQTRGLSSSWEYVYDNFAQWNAAIRQSRANGTPPVPALVLEGSGQPLLEALDGFTSVEPADEQALNVVIAREQPGQRAGIAPAGVEGGGGAPQGSDKP